MSHWERREERKEQLGAINVGLKNGSQGQLVTALGCDPGLMPWTSSPSHPHLRSGAGHNTQQGSF